MLDWIHGHQALLWWLVASSVFTFVATLVAVPLWIVRIPGDYFRRRWLLGKPWASRHPVVRGALLVGKNLLGWIFLTTGILMLVLPGQGVLTILVGVMLLDFPGKHGLEQWILTRPRVLHSVNWLRRQAGRDPLVLW